MTAATARPVVAPKGGGAKHSGGQQIPRRKRIKLTPWKAFHFLHRLVILAMALQYAVLNFQASWYTMRLLTEDDIPITAEEPTEFENMGSWIGKVSIPLSPLVVEAFENDTAPREGMLFLQNTTLATFSACDSLGDISQTVYNDTYQREMFTALVEDTNYYFHWSSYGDLELVAPIVDCSSWMVRLNARNTAIFYFLVRRRSEPALPRLVVVKLTNQEYNIPTQSSIGPAAVATVAIITNLTASQVDHVHVVSFGYPFEPLDFHVCSFNGTTNDNFWTLATVPKSSDDIPKNLTTAAVSGFYVESRSEQAHLLNELPSLDQNPINVITRSITNLKSVLRDTWGWVHFLQLFLGLELLINLVPLVLVSYRSIMAGNLWIGDAFVSISSTISVRGAAIIFSWHISKYWTIRELCVHDAYYLSDSTNLAIYDAIARADLLGLYLSVCGILGVITRERIDPLLATIFFQIGFDYRARIARFFPSLITWASDWAYTDEGSSAANPIDGQERISPMQFWTPHKMEHTPMKLYMMVIGPVTFTLIFICIQIIVTKIYRYFRPSTTRVLQRTTDRSGQKQSDGETMTLYKRVLTLFEIATGAELENRFGLMSDYENYVFFKGMKFASADGVYSNGFVIVNDKFVMPTSAYFKVVVMKLLRRRYTSVYVYEMSGTTVQQTARLVYPDTMSFSDLLRLSIAILS